MVSTVPVRRWGWECLSVRTAAWLIPCVYPQPHAMRLDSLRVVCKSQSGAKTMHPVNIPKGHTPTAKAQASLLLDAPHTALQVKE